MLIPAGRDAFSLKGVLDPFHCLEWPEKKSCEDTTEKTPFNVSTTGSYILNCFAKNEPGYDDEKHLDNLPWIKIKYNAVHLYLCLKCFTTSNVVEFEKRVLLFSVSYVRIIFLIFVPALIFFIFPQSWDLLVYFVYKHKNKGSGTRLHVLMYLLISHPYFL